jgi:CheY-like chemotaxis protein
MRTVILRIPKGDLGDRMAAMRTWLDERGFGPTSFRCNDLGNGEIHVRLDFESRDQADKFVAAFKKPKAAILVVDDEPDVRQVVSDALSYEGFKVFEAGSGSEALYRLRSNAKIDLLFTDIVMPGNVDGFELARHAKELRPDLRIIFTTGYFRDPPAAQGAISDAAMLRKPFQNEKLMAVVRHALS